jgi:hypothetical protein
VCPRGDGVAAGLKLHFGQQMCIGKTLVFLCAAISRYGRATDVWSLRSDEACAGATMKAAEQKNIAPPIE